MSKVFFLLAACIMMLSCQNNEDYKETIKDPDYLHRNMQNLTDIIVYDIFSPPVASRNYVYPSIGAYEIVSQTSDDYVSLSGQLREFNGVPSIPNEKVDPYLAAIMAFNQIGRNFIFSEDKMDAYESELLSEWKNMRIPNKVIKASKKYADTVAAVIVDWANGDFYKQTRTYPKFSVTDEPGRWKLTPPAYIDAIEPHWRLIRPMVIDSAQQFRPEGPPPFDMSKNSDFYNETMVVYEAVKNASEEEVEIASFWDCNPYVMNTTGHVMFATKKITPGGHWIGIAKIASEKSNADFLKSIEAYTATAIALFDGFISCWDEKYFSNLIRPETVINEYIDADWKPVLQTPPFPEHTSGHSVVSGASGVILTDIYGENFEFDDDTEVRYGLPVRHFKSFTDASDEAAISRLYGGIHYMPAIDLGVKQGRTLGKFITDHITMSK